jgi:hypothetical protein
MSYTYYVYDQIARDVAIERKSEAIKNRRWCQALKLARKRIKK